MNTKNIKALKWYKNSLIRELTKAGINIEDVIDVDGIDAIINDLDAIRRVAALLAGAEHAAGFAEGYKTGRDDGYEKGHNDGHLKGRSDGYDAAKTKYTSSEADDPNIRIKDRIEIKVGSSIFRESSYNVYVDGEYVGCMWSKGDAIALGEDHIARLTANESDM